MVIDGKGGISRVVLAPGEAVMAHVVIDPAGSEHPLAIARADGRGRVEIRPFEGEEPGVVFVNGKVRVECQLFDTLR